MSPSDFDDQWEVIYSISPVILQRFDCVLTLSTPKSLVLPRQAQYAPLTASDLTLYLYLLPMEAPFFCHRSVTSALQAELGLNGPIPNGDLLQCTLKLNG